jgi:hypothetical protein
MNQKIKLPFLVVLAALLIAGAASAQVYTGTIAGRVTDQTGAVLPGVTVTLTGPKLLQPQVSISSETGAFRFADLPVGTYIVTCELSGFQTVVREDLILNAGATVTVNIQLGLAQVAEVVTVSGETPVVDVRETGIPQTFDRDRLENIPSARDPWVVIEQTPGMVMDRQNVGGNESGQQSTFVTRGTSFTQNIWNYDGVNITDNAAQGATPMYYDFGAFDEINVTTGGQDTSMQTSGTQISFIIKQGTNDFSGQAAFYGTDGSLQSENVDAELQAQGAGAGAPIKYILDYGFDVGGPIVKDRAWIWGDYGVQDIHKGVVGFLKPGCTDPNDKNCLQDDPTSLKNFNIKFNLQAADNNRFNFLLGYNNKTRDTRGASDLRPLETTWKQSGPVYVWKFEDQHTFNPFFMMTGRFAYVDGGFALDYQDPGLRDVQTTYDYSTGAYGRSYADYQTIRPQYVGNLDGNYFLSNALGGDHEFKFGYQYKKTPVDSFSTYGGDAWAVFDGGVPVEAWMYRNAGINYSGTYQGLHFQDVFTQGRMMLKLGLRYDYQTGQNNPAQIPANMVAPDLLPAVDFAGTPALDAWNTLSPRVGFTYDLTGDGKTIVRANYGRYYDILDLYGIVQKTNGALYAEIDYPWNDLNGDTLVQRDEIDTSVVLYNANIDPANPGSLESPNQIDPGLSAPATDEFIVGLEREIRPEFSVGANYIYKRFTNMLWDDWYPDGGVLGIDQPWVGVTRDDFVPTTETFNGQTITYYRPAPGVSKIGDFVTNWPDYHQRYQGIELTAAKRLADRWMMNAGFTFADHREYFESDAAVFDPTNIDIRDGEQVYYGSSGSGKSGFFMNSRWNFKLDGMVQAGWGIHIAGKLNGREGFVFPETFRTASRPGGAGRAEVLFNPLGDTRLEQLWVADLRVEKQFTFGQQRFSAMMDIFNLFNEPTVLGRERRQNLSTANRVQDILSARIVRFGVRFNW